MSATRSEGAPISSPDDTLEVALSLARVGWPVFPVKLVPVVRADGAEATDKRPLVKWLEGASTDAEQVATWFAAQFPGAWIGVHTERAGIVVADLDLAKGKRPDGATELGKAGHELPVTLNYLTHSGGSHYLYKAPKGAKLTIARDHPVKGVDIRAGGGLMVYYGPKLDGKPELAKAPRWALVERTSDTGRGADGDVSGWLERATPGKPKGDLKQLLNGTDWRELDHDDMLAAVSTIIKHGGERGAATVYAEALERYTDERPDRRRDWDNAAAGSIGKHGVPPVTLELSKAERKAVAARGDPEAVEAAGKERKAEYRQGVHAKRADKAGQRVLEDGPLAIEIAEELTPTWAWTLGRGLMRYNGRVWGEAQEHDLIEQVRQSLDVIEVEEHGVAVHRGDNKGIDKARTLLSRGRARAVSGFVVGRLAIYDHAFDARPDLLNAQNGVVNLRTGKLEPHDAALYLTKIAAVDYNPKADMSTWEKALTALPRKVAAWLKIRMGQSATGHTPDDDVLVLLEGAGDNGKTTIIHAPRMALGDYSTRVPARLLDADPGDHPTTLMTLMGARLAIVEELPEGRNLNVKRLKDAVGTPEITARRMRQDDVTFKSTHALFLSTNYLPIVAETDHGTWRRLVLVRFPYRFVRRKKDMKSHRDRVGDPHLKRALAEPDEGVLRWLVEGARQWYELDETMPSPPNRVEADTIEWRLDADPVLAYITERLKLTPQAADGSEVAIACDDLAGDFNDSLERRGHRRWSAQTVNARFDGHVAMVGVQRKRVMFGRVRPSRPSFTIKPLSPNTQAWVGVQFADEPTSAPKSVEVLDFERKLHDAD